MDTNINISTFNNYFLKKEIQISPLTYRTKIVNYSSFSINEVNIADKISQIPCYSNYFSILADYEDLNISQLNEDIFEKLKNTKEIKYYLFKYFDKNSVDFIDFLYDIKSIKKLILDMINSCQHLLYGLELLNKNNICFFNISSKNIIFLENYREKPVLSNFKFSLQLNPLNYNYFLNILNKLDDLTYQPFEIHILLYIQKHNITTISYALIEEFSVNFIEQLSILRLFSQNYKKIYKEQCIETMKKYINMPQKNIIDNILDRNNKWDVYGISMLYLQIFGCISRIFSLKETFIGKITLELSKNLHPDSDKRLSLNNTLTIFNKLLNEQDNWNFVNNLDNNKLDKLFDDLAN